MEPQETDRTPGYVNQLSGAMDRLANAIGDATTASRKYAKSLARATWALVFATIVLVAVTAVQVYLAATSSDEDSTESTVAARASR